MQPVGCLVLILLREGVLTNAHLALGLLGAVCSAAIPMALRLPARTNQPPAIAPTIK